MVLESLRAGAGLGVLAAAAFVAFAHPMVVLVYQRGAFSETDALAVAGILSVFAFAVPGWVTQQIAVRAFYARSDAWRPMLLGTAVALGAIPLYLGLRGSFGAEGLAAAGVIAMSLNALLTLLMARRLHGAPSLSALGATLARALAIATAAAVLGGLVGGSARALGAGCGSAAAALVELAGGGGVFVVSALAGTWWFGGVAMRTPLERIAGRFGLGR